MIYIDSDNGLGSLLGNVDGGFAIAALLASQEQVAGIGATFGETSVDRALKNNRFLGRHFGFHGPYLMGAKTPGQRQSEASRFICAAPLSRLIAMGPLTNIAAALLQDPALAGRVNDCIIVGGQFEGAGDFASRFRRVTTALSNDIWASHIVFASRLPITLIPMHVGEKLLVQEDDLKTVHGPLGIRLRVYMKPWQLRSRLFKGKAAFSVADLVAAMVLLDPSLFKFVSGRVSIDHKGRLRRAEKGRPVRIVADFDPQAVWRKYMQLLTGEPHRLAK